jgi:hypothetical protein
MSDNGVRELKDGTPGAEHSAIRMLIASLRYMGQCSAGNIKRYMQAHPSFSSRTITVVRLPDCLSGSNFETEYAQNCNIQKVDGVGDFVIVYS